MTEPSADLLKRAQRGDRSAVEAVLGHVVDEVRMVCVRMCDADGDDACQVALIKIATSLASFNGESKLTTWCHRIAVNASLDELRRRSRRAEPIDWADASTKAHLDLPEAPDTTLGVVHALDIAEALRSIPTEFRAVVVMRDAYGLDYAEIAELLDLPPGTVRSRISRGRRLLAKALSPTSEGSGRTGGTTEPGGTLSETSRTREPDVTSRTSKDHQ